MYKKILILICIILTLSLIGCQGVKDTNGKTIIAVSILPQKAFLEAICGDLVDILVLVPPGTSPENYEPSPKEIEKFSKASLYFTIGVETEEANILPRAKNIKTVRLEELVGQVYPDLYFDDGGRDPHIWLSIERASLMVELMAKEMGALDPDNKETYDLNSKAYIEKLDKLSKDIDDILKEKENRNFIVFHPAFAYFADEHNLIMHALEEEGKEARPKDLEKMIEFAKEEDIKTIFYQAEIDRSQAQAFANEIKGKMVELSPLSEDYINNLREMARLIAEG